MDNKEADLFVNAVISNLRKNEAKLSLMIYRMVGDGEGRRINLNTVRAAINYIDGSTLEDIGIVTPIEGGAVWFENENGKINAIVTETGLVINDQYKIKKFMENLPK